MPGWEGNYCGIQRHVSSRDELVRCASLLCPRNTCKPVEAPSNEATALVYLVFGIEGIDKTSVDLRHVLKETEVCILIYCSDELNYTTLLRLKFE